MRKYMLLVVLALAVVTLLTVSVAPALACEPLSPGYWMNHPQAWHQDSYDVAWNGIWYSKTQAIQLMKHPTAGDMSYAMFQAVMAGQLNAELGAGAYSAWAPCRGWLQTYPPGSGVSASSDAWQGIESYYASLCNWWDSAVTD